MHSTASSKLQEEGTGVAVLVRVGQRPSTASSCSLVVPVLLTCAACVCPADIDIHHGDGVETAFQRTDKVGNLLVII